MRSNHDLSPGLSVVYVLTLPCILRSSWRLNAGLRVKIFGFWCTNTSTDRTNPWKCCFSHHFSTALSSVALQAVWTESLSSFIFCLTFPELCNICLTWDVFFISTFHLFPFLASLNRISLSERDTDFSNQTLMNWLNKEVLNRFNWRNQWTCRHVPLCQWSLHTLINSYINPPHTHRGNLWSKYKETCWLACKR